VPRPGAYAALAAVAIALGVLLNLPSLGAGLAGDDYVQRAMLEGRYPVPRAAWDLFSFVDGAAELEPLRAAGALPWWSQEDLRAAALRPLASLLIVLEHRWLRLSPLAQHVHSLAWFVVMVGAVALLARRLLPRAAAALAVLLFAIDPAHVIPIAWLANRSALLSSSLGLLALWAHLRFREQAWRPGRPLALLGFSLALAAGEYALGLLAYLVSYELMAAPGRRGERVRASLIGLAPAAVYASLHMALGYGVRGSAVYLDPFESPAKFAFSALLRIPALLASELWAVPPEPLVAGSVIGGIAGWLLLLAAIALLLSLVPGALARTAAQGDRRLLAFAVGALLSLVPLAGTSPHARLLVVPSVGGSLVLAALLWDAAHALSNAERRRKLASWLRVALTLPLAGLHFLAAPVATLGGSIGWRDLNVRLRSAYLAAPIDDRQVAEQTLVLVNAVETFSLIYTPYARAAEGRPMPKHWRVLSITHRWQTLERVADDTLELQIDEGGMLGDPISQLYRAWDNPFAPGDVVALPDLSAEVVDVGEWGPTRVRFRFARSLDHPSIVLLVWYKGVLRRLPALGIGRSARIPPG
jgi:hypothetical protein